MRVGFSTSVRLCVCRCVCMRLGLQVMFVCMQDVVCAFVCLSVCMYAIRILYKCAFVCSSVCMYAIRILHKCAFVFVVGVYVCD